MRNYFIIIVLAMFALAFISVGCAGKDSLCRAMESATLDLPNRGSRVKYIFEFKVDGTNVTWQSSSWRTD